MLHHEETLTSSFPTTDESVMNIPPHIAARFYRNKKASGRRRSSSSSSTTTPTLIHATDRAHFRRASFLESRKSRLAARSLHAERVRSKANHDSHQILSDRLQALKRSLESAQEARNALLAKTAASCAGEVAKAKAVAEEVRSRREEELAQLKDGMKERLKLAEERRLELLRSRTQRRARGSSAGRQAADVEDAVAPLLRKQTKEEQEEEALKLDDATERPERSDEEKQDEAARKVQRFWRTQRNRLVVKRFTDLGITIESVKEKSFDDASMLVMNPQLLNATANLLRLCGLLDNNDSSTTDAAGVNKSCRIFLSAYLILGHPAEVLSNDGENEKALMTQSKDLLCAFECWLSTASAHNCYMGAPHLRAALVEAYQPFAIAFTAWKERDQAELLDGMMAQFVELDLLWQKVKQDSEPQVAQEYHEGIKENQMLILSKLKSLGGQRAVLALKKAVSKARRTRLKKKDDSKPRAVQDVGEAPVSPISPVAPATPMAPTDTRLGQFVETHEEDDTLDSSTATGGYQVDDSSKYMLSNRQIAHELLLNRDFKLQPREKSPIEKMVEDEAERAFYDMMREDIANGESERWIPSMAETVRQKLLRLVSPGSSLHQLISSVIDIEHISQQCRANVYDHVSFFKFIYSLLPSICSPARDEAVRNLANEDDDYITRLEKLLDVLELMQMDHANYLLMVSAPHILPEAIPYERRMFAQQIEGKLNGLRKVETWLRTASEEKAAEAQSRDPEGVNHPRSRPTTASVYNHAFANLIVSLEPFDPSSLPETFELDVERMYIYRQQVRTVILSSAMLLTIKSLLRRDARTSWKSLKEHIVSLLHSHGLTPDAKARKVLDHMKESPNVPRTNETQSSHIISALTRLFNAETCGADPVVKVMMNRLRGFILARLNAATPKEKVRLAAGAGETLTSFGMAEQVGDVGSLVESLVKLGGINQTVYAEWYGRILEGAV